VRSGNTADANHITAPHPDGVGASRRCAPAIRDAAEPRRRSVHQRPRTSTDLGDVAETKAVKQYSRAREEADDLQHQEPDRPLLGASAAWKRSRVR